VPFDYFRSPVGRCRRTPWAAVISAIISGDVEVFDSGTQRRTLRFALSVKDVTPFVAGVRKHLGDASRSANFAEWIAHPTAAEILRVNEAFLSRLAKLRPELLPQRGSGNMPYRATDVLNVADEYMFVPEIALALVQHPRLAVAWLRSNGLEPVITLQEDRDFGYLRSEVEALLAEAPVQQPSTAEDAVRTRFIQRVADNENVRTVAAEMEIDQQLAERWTEVWLASGGKIKHWVAIAASIPLIREIVAENPEISVVGIQFGLRARNITSTRSSIASALDVFGIRSAVQTLSDDVAD
jgi:hypothetical protein